MLLRSSSTPIPGPLLPCSSPFFSESSNNGLQLHNQSLERTASSFLQGISCRYSLDSSDLDPPAGIRRTRSEGSIIDLLPKCSDDSHSHKLPKPSSKRRRDPVLDTIPSFSIYDSMAVDEEECEEQQEQEKEVDRIVAGFSFSDQGAGDGIHRAPQPLFLARGLGIDRLASGLMNLWGDGSGAVVGGDGGGSDGNCSVKVGSGGEGDEVEVYYKSMIEEDPSNALILRNYAQFLHQCKKDDVRAEEYYSRAILADPGDAETISQYGNLLWEVHGDIERASTYLKRAANMDQDNCFVQASYASFLWGTEEEDEVEENKSQGTYGMPLHLGTLASASS